MVQGNLQGGCPTYTLSFASCCVGDCLSACPGLHTIDAGMIQEIPRDYLLKRLGGLVGKK